MPFITITSTDISWISMPPAGRNTDQVLTKAVPTPTIPRLVVGDV
ncbi:MAG: hypothetical protein WD037_02710 [Balneolales bacterium]